MQYFVRIHVPTGIIEGYMEQSTLEKLQSAHKGQSSVVCDTRLMQGSRYDSNPTYISILPTQIIAIESKFVR